MGRLRALFVTPLMLVSTLAVAEAPPISDKTAVEFNRRMQGVGSGAARVDKLIQIVWYERPGGELQAYAEADLEAECISGVGSLIREFKNGPLPVRRLAISLMQRRWQPLTRGSDPALIDLVGQSLSDPDPVIHRTAATIAATNVMEGIANQAIDAAIADPELTVAALRAIALANDESGARWSIRQLQSTDVRVRLSALATVARLARVTLPMLRVQLESSDINERRSALDGLLLVATRADIPLLTRWLETSEDPSRVESVTKAIAQLQSGRYAPLPPPPVEPLFATPLPDDTGEKKKRRHK